MIIEVINPGVITRLVKQMKRSNALRTDPHSFFLSFVSSDYWELSFYYHQPDAVKCPPHTLVGTVTCLGEQRETENVVDGVFPFVSWMSLEGVHRCPITGIG